VWAVVERGRDGPERISVLSIEQEKKEKLNVLEGETGGNEEGFPRAAEKQEAGEDYEEAGGMKEEGE